MNKIMTYDEFIDRVIILPWLLYGEHLKEGECSELANTAIAELRESVPELFYYKIRCEDPNYFRDANHIAIIGLEKKLEKGYIYKKDEPSKLTRYLEDVDAQLIDTSFKQNRPLKGSDYLVKEVRGDDIIYQSVPIMMHLGSWKPIFIAEDKQLISFYRNKKGKIIFQIQQPRGKHNYYNPTENKEPPIKTEEFDRWIEWLTKEQESLLTLNSSLQLDHPQS